MKRIALTVTLSLIMCLFMSFPASAAYMVKNPRNSLSLIDLVKADIITKYPAGYDYVILFVEVLASTWDVSSPPHVGFRFMVSNTPILSVGSYVYSGVIISGSQVGNTDIDNGRYTIITEISNNNSRYAQIKYKKDNSSTQYTQFVCGIFTKESTLSLYNFDAIQAEFLKAGYDLDWRLAPSVDPAALQALLAQAKAKQNTGYTQSTWNALQSQITAAENLLATTGYTQQQIDSAKNALQAALDGLVFLPDTPDLAALLREADAIEDVGYTVTTWARFSNSRISSHALLAGRDYTQNQLNYNYNELQSSMSGLALTPPPEPPKPEPAPLGYDLKTGDISGYLNVMPRITYGYIDTMKPIFIGIFGIIISILIIPRVLAVIIPHLRR